MTDKRTALLHITAPFCVKPCGWKPSCQQAILEGWNSKRQQAYMEAVQREIEANAEQFADVRIEAVRFGGGVASNAGEHISHTMRLVRKLYDVAEGAPVTMRSSISNISGANMPWFKRAGVARFDFEMMSMNQASFSVLNKNDAWDDFIIMCDYILKTYMTDYLGLILAYGYGDKNGNDAVALNDFRKSVVEAATTRATHITLWHYEGANPAPACAELSAEQLQVARKVLVDRGFTEYIPLHFGRGGFSSDRFFAGRAAGEDVIAFGLGAQTRFDGALSTNTSDLATYLTHADDYTKITAGIEPI
jgi:oxygen-independent coproporphyrinogen-3 oxidase